jgi:hypothetical protein
MKPLPTSAVAVQWHFRCDGSKLPDHSWTWLCRSKEGFVLAKSSGPFRSLREAIADAESNGFVHRPAAHAPGIATAPPEPVRR